MNPRTPRRYGEFVVSCRARAWADGDLYIGCEYCTTPMGTRRLWVHAARPVLWLSRLLGRLADALALHAYHSAPPYLRIPDDAPSAIALLAKHPNRAYYTITTEQLERESADA